MNSVIAFFLLICVLVFVHEYGHFWAARRCGVKVHRFSIGFGKVLWKKRDKYGTEFSFSLIPLGGYVQMADKNSDPALPSSETLSGKSVAQRAFIIAAGPAVNFLFAILLYWAVYLSGITVIKPVVDEVLPDSIAAKAMMPKEFEIRQINGVGVNDWEEVLQGLVAAVGQSEVEIVGRTDDGEKIVRFDLQEWQISPENNPLTTLGIRPKTAKVEPIIHSVVNGSAAEQAGILAGDKILKINHQPFDWHFLVTQVQTGQPVLLLIEQNGQQREVSVTPVKSDKEQRYLIGIQPSYQPLAEQYRVELKYDMLTAFAKSLEKVANLSEGIVQFIGKLVSGNLSVQNLGGPITMAKGASATASEGVLPFLSFMALISVNLGVMNLLPLLPLDGGRLLCLGYEGIFGRPLPQKFELGFQQLGVMLVLGLMLMTFFNDIIHF